MANKPSSGHRSAGAPVHNAGAASQAAPTPTVDDGNGNVSGSDSPVSKQSGKWSEYATRLVDFMNESDLIPTRVLTSLSGAPTYFTCRGYGIHVLKSDELLTVVFSNGNKHPIK